MSGLHIPVIEPDADTLTAALAYAEAGWYVGYTDPSYHDPKSPEVMGKRWQTKTSRDRQTIVGWYAGRKQLGVFLHAGRSGAWVADVDHPEHMPEVLADACSWAPYQSTRPDTPGRGHYLFRQPPGRILGNSVGGLGKGWGEARGRNGVIVVWPTPHPDGGEYRWERIGTVLELPGAVAGLLNDTSPAEDAVTDDELTEFVKAHTSAERPELLRAVTSAYTSATAEGQSRHESAVKVTCWAMREAAAGFYPALDAARTLRDLYTEARGHDRDGGRGAVDEASARTEYHSILAWAIGQVATVDLDELRTKVNGRVPDDVTIIDSGSRPAPDPAEPCNLTEAHTVFRRWLGKEYDLDALNATLATAAAEHLGGDPLWLLLVSGSGNAKTETVQALKRTGAYVVSTIASDGALLSGTSRQQRAKNATGGLLRQIGDRGLLVIKDVTSILSMDRNTRQSVLAAIREIHDGHWVRYLGTDGGKTLEWSGHLVIVGAVTTAWDRAHDVIASMGDRFLILRMDSTEGRLGAGRQSRRNVNHEEQMRAELSAAVAGVLATAALDDVELTDDESERLLAAADLVTLARTGVDFDYRGDVIDAHAPEMPTRFMKQLVQIVRGGVAIGMRRHEALRLAVRCARDSMPPLRLAILDDIAEHPASTPTDVRRRIDKPRATVDRQLQALHILGVAWLDEEERADGKTTWRYSLPDGIDPTTLRT